ncbi:hypothetical protein G6F18_003230 [Rhizopus arrhizus]|uniref:Uncharacterized protein n=1 Tax=Rhizopus oryzae TaxID=64495 RepID=A0A9P6XGP8_RHIOR|nr:hypothetical protein G6F18_003230 [Rhizopus arrhizus]KAG0918199.1 hypothetical protein G6F33_000761 [Rhizopus arrhizus]KAG1118457.1 hypothetical protein G6F40_002185 [Rhizopus arrhizus]KAG1186744.1 hypothetical protein G6F36_005947 [Rhizopus arrhizus]KAG1313551.1 hypothetical protein G6F64_002168 [Rhizopus arrhizus]
MDELIEESDKPRLSDFVSLNTKSLVLYFYNKDILDSNMIRQELSDIVMEFRDPHSNLVISNNKNSVDWFELSNKVKQYKAFCLISENENDKFLEGAKEFIDRPIDPFANDSKYISPLVLKQNIKDWKAKAIHIDKLHLQDLLYYYIIDLTSVNKNDGTHAPFGLKFEAEKEKYKTNYNPKKNIAKLTRELLGLSKPSSTSSSDNDLQKILKSGKASIAAVADEEIRNNMKVIVKTCKIYVKLEKEKIKLYESETNEATYLMC